MFEISPVKWLIDILINYDKRRIEDNETRFRQLFERMFHELLTIQNSYIAMLRKCEYLLPEYADTGVGQPGWLINSQRISVNDLPLEIKKVINTWKELREESGAERVDLRARAVELVKCVSDPIEQRFVFSVINYFIHPERTYFYSDHVDSRVESLLEKGSDAILDSPSLTVLENLERIKSKSDPDEIRVIFMKQRDDLVQRWSEICQRYNELYVARTLR